jgi:hypothetical protein
MIHIQTWKSQPAAIITDMTNAGKRGKVCRVFYWEGFRSRAANYSVADNNSLQTEIAIDNLKRTPGIGFDEACTLVRFSVSEYPCEFAKVSEREIRGVDAPR